MQVLISMLLGNTAVAIALALMALVAMRLCRPAVAHVLWLLVIVKLLTPPVWRVEVIADDARVEPREAMIVVEAGTADGTTSPEFTHTTAATVAESAVTPVMPRQTPPAAHPVPVSPLFSPAPRVTTLCLPCLLAGVWTVGSLAWATIALIRIARFRRLLRAGRPAAGDLCDEVAGVAARIGVRRVPELRLVDAAISPMLFFLGRRVQLVLPEQLIEQMSRGQREGVIAHELAHLRRGDHWVRLLEMVATAILWWHPVLWLARRGLREAEEQCCDAWVVSLLPDARRRYADALVDALELVAARGLTLPAGATGLGRIAHLQRRLTMILTMNAPKSLSASGKLALALLAFTLLPMVPVRGQAKPPVSPPGEASGQASSTAAPATRPAPSKHDDAYKAVEALLEAAAQDSDASVQNAANAAIAQFGPRAVPALLDAVKHEKRAATARQLLSGLGSDSVDPLLAAVDSDDAVVRREALTAVGSILSRVWGTAGPMGGFAPGGGGGYSGGYGGRAAPGMAAEMEGMGMGGFGGGGGGNLTSALVQEGDRYALSDQAKRLIGAATKATRDDDVGVRRAAVALLHHLAPVAAMTNQLDAVLSTIIAAMKDADADVRGAAAWAITAVGPPASGATDALTAATKDEQYEVRYAALSALKSMGPFARAATPAVIAAIKDPHPQVRAAAAEALGALQSPMPATQPGEAPHGAQHLPMAH